MSKLISVLILTYQGEKIIEKCLDGVFNQKLNEKDLEVLVLDNGSSDRTFSILKDNPHISLFKNEKNKSFTSGYNKLYKKSKGDFILILSNDVFLEGDSFFQKLIPILENSIENGAIAPKSIKSDGSIEQIPKREVALNDLFIDYTILGPIIRFFYPATKRSSNNYSLEQSIYDADVLQDSCLLVKRSALDMNKIFDETMKFYYTEDYLSDRIRSKKMKLIYSIDSKVHHLYRHGTSKMSKLKITWIYLLDALSYTSYKNNPFLAYLILAPIAFLTLLIRTIYWFVRRDIEWKK